VLRIIIQLSRNLNNYLNRFFEISGDTNGWECWDYVCSYTILTIFITPDLEKIVCDIYLHVSYDLCIIKMITIENLRELCNYGTHKVLKT
jgi:hypothetical protein